MFWFRWLCMMLLCGAPNAGYAISATVANTFAFSVTEDGWAASMGVGFDNRTGSVEALGGSADLSLSLFRVQTERTWHQTKLHALPGYHHLGYIAASGDLAQQGGTRYKQSSFLHARYTHMFWQMLGLETFVQHATDAFRSLDSRTLVGVGTRIDLVRRSGVNAWFGSAAMPEWERETGLGQTFWVRWSNVLGMAARTEDDRWQMLMLHYFQPRLDRMEDLRSLHILDASVQIWEVLRFGVVGKAQYDAAPAQAIVPWDTEIKLMLRFLMSN